MPIISIAIQKGGSGKTTTVINLAAYLHRKGLRVMVVDLDPQANLTQSLGMLEEPRLNIYHALKQIARGEEVALEQTIYSVKGLDLVPSSLELAVAEMELVSIYGREKLLQQLLDPIKSRYDFIFIDCPPAFGMLTVNGLTASQYVLVPLQAEFLPLKGLESFMRSLKAIEKQINPQLEVLGYVFTKFDQRKKMNREVVEQLTRLYGPQVCSTRIRSNISLAQAQEKGVDIFDFAKNSAGAQDYGTLAEELLEKLELKRRNPPPG